MKNIALILCCLFLSSCPSFFRAISYSPSIKVKEISFLDEETTKGFQFYYSDTLVVAHFNGHDNSILDSN